LPHVSPEGLLHTGECTDSKKRTASKAVLKQKIDAGPCIISDFESVPSVFRIHKSPADHRRQHLCLRNRQRITRKDIAIEHDQIG
jgi:hypothetical protein